MSKRILKDQRGIGIVIVVLIVVLIAAIAGTGYFVLGKNKDKANDAVTNAASQAAKESCKKEIDDEDFCKFASNVAVNSDTKATYTTSYDGTTSTMAVETDSSGNSHSVTSSNGTVVAEIISLNNVTYMKDLGDGQWTKFESQDTNPVDTAPTDDLDFEFDDTTTAETDKTQYKNLGKEACGSLTCFKYQIIDPTTPTDEHFIWFDTDDYKLRRMSTKNTEGSMDATFSYEKVTITEPSPIKETSTPGIDAATQAQIDAAMRELEAAQ